MEYNRVNWKDFPDTSTKMSAENFNKMDEGIAEAAEEINANKEKIDELSSQLVASDNLKFRFATDGEGNYGYLGADDSFVPFKSGNPNLRYDEENGMIQALDTDGQWVNIYSTSSLPIPALKTYTQTGHGSTFTAKYTPISIVSASVVLYRQDGTSRTYYDVYNATASFSGNTITVSRGSLQRTYYTGYYSGATNDYNVTYTYRPSN